jgi:hypothetical protein
MNTIDLKAHVASALKTEWASFAAEHPRLASVIDETLLVQQATDALRDDEEFAHALATAAAAGILLEALHELILRRIRTWMNALW